MTNTVNTVNTVNNSDTLAIQPAAQAAPEPAMDQAEFDAIAVINNENFDYTLPDGDAFDRLNVIGTIALDIATATGAIATTIAEARALEGSIMRRRDAGVLAIAALYRETPAKVIQAKLHRVYGGKIDAKGKVSKTVPAGDGEAFMKASKAYYEAFDFIENGNIPESWNRGEGLRGATAALLDPIDKDELAYEIETKSKINVSDTVSRFFRDKQEKAAPFWMNPKKIDDLTATLMVNADYLRGASDVRLAYEALFAMFHSITKSAT